MGGSSHISNQRLLPGHFIRSLPTFLRNGNAISIATTAGLSTIALKGMTEDVVKRSIDGCTRPHAACWPLWEASQLSRPQLVHKASYYAAKKGFWDIHANKRAAGCGPM